jgi:hypothetical protein
MVKKAHDGNIENFSDVLTYSSPLVYTGTGGTIYEQQLIFV